MPLAFTQEDFLVMCIITVIQKVLRNNLISSLFSIACTTTCMVLLDSSIVVTVDLTNLNLIGLKDRVDYTARIVWPIYIEWLV